MTCATHKRLRSFAGVVGASVLVLVGASAGARAAGRVGPVPRAADPIPVLMYHVIADPPAGAPFPELYVSRSDFAAQVRWLARHGYHAVTLDQARAHWFDGLPLPAHPIVFSFDDGYRSQAVTAAPILHRLGWAGVINVEVRNTTNFWGLPPAEVRALLADGWQVAAHTLTHPDLTRVGAAQLTAEVAGSRAALRRMFHVPVDFFCYPAGRYDSRVVAAVQAAGYVGATTTTEGLARPTAMFTLDRVRVNRSDGIAGLVQKLGALGAGA